jgi:antitoxin (DNA-binding transcriptional repressor) of toxin-antitoxin stability system
VKNTYTIRELQRDTAAAVRGAETGALVTVTRHEKPVVHLISDERLGALLETLELAGNSNFAAAVANLTAGKTKFRRASAL